jgi:uncharacterized membrane protein
MFDNLDPLQAGFLVTITASLLGLILTILILWLIIRSATLSALRKHAAEERELARSTRGGSSHDV